MANYSYIGYAPGVISFGGGAITLSNGFDPDTDRVIFDVTDGAGGTVLSGRADNGILFDGDRFNNETGDDSTQTGVVRNLDGTPTGTSGNMYLEQSYTLAKPGGGSIELFRVEVDGTLVGYITSEPLVPGTNYSFTTSNVTPSNAPDTTDPGALTDVPCFTAGTMIRTDQGERAIETLEVGDRVLTEAGTAEAIRWIGHRVVLPAFTSSNALWPVRISAGSLGNGLPQQDLLVSPNHRMLIRSPRNELLYGEGSVLVAAKFLVGQPGIEQVFDLPRVTYFHLLFDDHQVIFANGAPSESLHPGDMALQSMARASRDEILTVFPELADSAGTTYGPTAAPVLKRNEARLLMSEIGFGNRRDLASHAKPGRTHQHDWTISQ
ncbi:MULTISPECIES: Hint domain-containing protein [unclassified Roseovarius]|uniref:Hint domain-containing protein n=1 Tax=unclassified Roseovarius TaxID=2614913 RepID=UPI00273DB629|nr:MULTISPECIES: Hint domain-containing protein [unclassified Roseovarius]